MVCPYILKLVRSLVEGLLRIDLSNDKLDLPDYGVRLREVNGAFECIRGGQGAATT